MTPTSTTNNFWLLLLLGFWAFYGLTGRDAWRAEEALALAPILDWLAGQVSVWATPAPLYTLFAGIAVKWQLAGGDVQDSARLVSGLFTVIALLFTSFAARALYGPGFGSAAAIALVGGFGLMLRAHALLPDTALLAAWAILLYGVTAAKRQPRGGMLAIGIGLTLLLLGLRGLPDLFAGLAILLVPLLFPGQRDAARRQTVWRGLLLAAGLIGLGLGYLWVAEHWQAWWQLHGVSRFSSISTPARAFSELPWFAWPLWPLAMAAIWHAHRRLPRATELHVPLFAVVVLLGAALVPAWSRDGALLPVLLPLALLSAYALENLRRGAAQAFYWFGALFFAVLVFAIWVYFAAIEWGYPVKLASRMARMTPNYAAGVVDAASVFVAVAATLIWLIAIPLFPRAKKRPILVWATGMILLWTLLVALYRPWFEAGWAYRPLIAEMSRHLPADACLNTRVDPAMRTMLSLHLRRATERTDCPWILVQTTRSPGKAEQTEATPGYSVVWAGFRPRYKSQIYRLEREAAGAD
jgi:4-amino-4-deoxy-L-arabinose transferase-like glycosyltransferase